MLDIGWTELLMVGLILIIVVGPKDLPKVLRTFGQWSARARKIARDFQDNIDEIARESEISDIKKQFEDPAGIKNDLENTIDPDNVLKDVVDMKFDDGLNENDKNNNFDNHVDKSDSYDKEKNEIQNESSNNTEMVGISKNIETSDLSQNEKENDQELSKSAN